MLMLPQMPSPPTTRETVLSDSAYLAIEVATFLTLIPFSIPNGPMRPDSPNDSLHASVIMGVRPSSGVTIYNIQQLLREVSCSLVEGHGILKGSEVLKILPVSALRIH